MGKGRWPSLLAVVAGLVLVVFFAVKAWHQWSYTQRIDSGAVQVESLRGWMTLSYIEKVYRVPQAQAREVLGLPSTGFEDRSLKDWFEVTGQDPATGRRKVEVLILQAAPAAPSTSSP
jgi:hypothetical protein